jgi:hypothetical protein
MGETMQVDKETPISEPIKGRGEMTPQEETIFPAMHGKWRKTIFVEIEDNGEKIQLKVRATYLGISKPKWEKEYYHNTYRIKITYLETGKSMSTRFWDSIKNTEEHRALTPEDILIATMMIFEDAFNFYDLRTPEEFMNEFGLDEKEARRVWNECGKIYENICEIGIDGEMQGRIINAIREHEDEDKLSELIKEVRTR